VELLIALFVIAGIIGACGGSGPRKGREGTERRSVKKVNVNNYGPPTMRHIEAMWGAAPPPRLPAGIEEAYHLGAH
jgi:hypothetical protein